jgi:hypothetical protein
MIHIGEAGGKIAIQILAFGDDETGRSLSEMETGEAFRWW